MVSLPSDSAAGVVRDEHLGRIERGAIGSTIAAATPARSGGSGMRSAIAAMRVGSSSERRRSKKASICASNSETVAPTCWTRDSTTRPCWSISPSSAVLRRAMRASVSSRMRAISAFDHSRTAATSSSARRRSSAASTAEAAWISSTTVLASAPRRAIVSSREVSTAVCMARLSSAMNFVGLRELEVAVASIISDVSGSSVGVDASLAVYSSTTVDPSAGASALGVSAFSDVRASAWAEGESCSAVQGSLKPGRVSV